MNPPGRALVLCVDKKSQDTGTEPCPTGVTAVVWVLNTRLRSSRHHSLGRSHRRHRVKAFLAFLNAIDPEAPKDLDIHLVMDNNGTHKTAKVYSWFAARPRYQVHFTPTSSSWINLVERFFALISGCWVKRNCASQHP